MYCLNCGTKIEDNQDCINCGMTVAEMQERLEVALERITYADAMWPNLTEKMQPVPERTYTDDKGNIIDPADDSLSEGDRREKRRRAINELPQIGQSDPFITMPVQKVVSDTGQVVADADTEAKIYLNDNTKPKTSKTPVAIAIIVVLVIIAAIVAVMMYMH